MKPPEGVTEKQWASARKRACAAELQRLNKIGGFYPHKIQEAFAQGWCDTSGRVVEFL